MLRQMGLVDVSREPSQEGCPDRSVSLVSPREQRVYVFSWSVCISPLLLDLSDIVVTLVAAREAPTIADYVLVL